MEREIQRKNLGPAGIRTHNLPLSRQMVLPLSYWNPDDRGAEIGVGEAQAVNLSTTQVVLHYPVWKYQEDQIFMRTQRESYDSD